MGQLGEYIRMALYNIRENKGRSFLTMLGIIIGISSVITIVAIGSGLKEDVMSSAQTKSVTVMADPEKSANTQLITWEDLKALKDQLGDQVTGVTNIAQAVGTAQTRKGSFDAYLTLTTPDEEQDPLQYPIIRGTYFNENDVENRSAVCILDKASALYRKLRKQRGSRDRGNQGQIQEKSGDLHRTLFPADSDISDPDGGDGVV